MNDTHKIKPVIVVPTAVPDMMSPLTVASLSTSVSHTVLAGENLNNVVGDAPGNLSELVARTIPSAGAIAATAEVAAFETYLALLRRLKGQPPDLVHLTTKEAAIFLRCSTKCLETRRVAGIPPVFQKHGSRVLYQLSALIDSLEARHNTCNAKGVKNEK